MIQRCENPNATGYERYGGRGIQVCERWRTFENFYAGMGERPEGMTLDRIDVDGNYEPSNCRWATDREQTRNASHNHRLTYGGETLTVAEWAEKTGLPYGVIYDRLRDGWTVEDVLTTPIQSNKSRKKRG